MTSVRLRPTFEVDSELSPEVLMRRVQESVAASEDLVSGQFRRDHGMISIVPSHRHFWSPWLHVEVVAADKTLVPKPDGQPPEHRPAGDNPKSQLRGRFSPHPTVWTGFMFGYLSLAVLVFFSLIGGAAQQMAGQLAWSYYVAPACLLLGLMLWFASQIGQRLAHQQMVELKSMVTSGIVARQDSEAHATSH